jgi:hypothetical protein
MRTSARGAFCVCTAAPARNPGRCSRASSHREEPQSSSPLEMTQHRDDRGHRPFCSWVRFLCRPQSVEVAPNSSGHRHPRSSQMSGILIVSVQPWREWRLGVRQPLSLQAAWSQRNLAMNLAQGRSLQSSRDVISLP